MGSVVLVVPVLTMPEMPTVIAPWESATELERSMTPLLEASTAHPPASKNVPETRLTDVLSKSPAGKVHEPEASWQNSSLTACFADVLPVQAKS